MLSKFSKWYTTELHANSNPDSHLYISAILAPAAKGPQFLQLLSKCLPTLFKGLPLKDIQMVKRHSETTITITSMP